MYGHATFKSHILRRDEKGIFGIPFKRLLGCGLGAGALFTGMRMAAPDMALPGGAIALILLLIFTAPRGGIPRYKHIIYDTRWLLLSAASLAPNTIAGKLGKAFGLPAEQIDIDATTLFDRQDADAPRTALTDWVSFTRASDADATDENSNTGLVFSPNAGLMLHGGTQ
jgi:hypothetical protein